MAVAVSCTEVPAARLGLAGVTWIETSFGGEAGAAGCGSGTKDAPGELPPPPHAPSAMSITNARTDDTT